MEKGRVVISKAGRDKNNFFIVLNTVGERVYIADGKIRKIENPKAKNIKHLQKTNMYFTIDDNVTNKKLKMMIKELDIKANSEKSL